MTDDRDSTPDEHGTGLPGGDLDDASDGVHDDDAAREGAARDDTAGPDGARDDTVRDDAAQDEDDGEAGSVDVDVTPDDDGTSDEEIPPDSDAEGPGEAALADAGPLVPQIFVPVDDEGAGADGTRRDDERDADDVRMDDDAWNDAMSRSVDPVAHELDVETRAIALVALGEPRPETASEAEPGARTVDADPGSADEPTEGDDATGEGDAPATSGEQSGWVLLARAMAPRANRSQLIAGVLCALLGFALVVQVRQNDESALSGLRQSELVRILDETTERGDQLRREVAELRGERDDLESGSDRHAAAIDSLRRSAITQGILSGRLPAQGPGVQVTLLDPDDGLQPVTMLNMLEELRNAGAEAIQLNDQRVTASSSFTGARGRVLLDGVELRAPYVWLAIGDPSTLSIALQIPGGAMATVRGTGATGTVDERDEVSITALRRLPDPSYATPAPPDGS